jgi:hypothetical protein
MGKRRGRSTNSTRRAGAARRAGDAVSGEGSEGSTRDATEIVRVLDQITSGSGMQSDAAGAPRWPGACSARRSRSARPPFIAVAILAKAAIVGIGLPDWVFPGSLILMALGLPVILWTGYVQRVTRRAVTATPTFTPGGTPSAGPARWRRSRSERRRT